MQITMKDSEGNSRRRAGLKMTLLAGAATLALAFPVAAMAQGFHGHGGGGHAGGAHFSGGHGGHAGGLHAAAVHGGGWHGGGWHGGGWHGGGWHGGWGYGGGWWPGYAYDYDWGYPYYGYAPGYASAWYCPNPAGYYPYVTQCYAPWQPTG
jgi:uncharacterized membrane protein